MADEQLLHLVLGGKLKDTTGYEFDDLSKIDIVGVFPDYSSAEKAWRAASQRSVDDAYTRYFVVHLHDLMHPGAEMDLKGHVLN